VWNDNLLNTWQISKIGVIGPGIVGMPMAALLAQARIKIGTEAPARVVVIQRNSPTSGWKVGAINSGRSTIGGIEPSLDELVAQSVGEGLLRASHDYSELSNADVILVCVQTDKNGFEPDYAPLFDALQDLTRALKSKPAEKLPLIIIESTLAPSSMATLVKEYFGQNGLSDGCDVLLGNSPNRVMPGRLVERVTTSDKIVAGINPVTPLLVERLYSHIVTAGKLLPTNSMTAEVVKTLENAYRDVRIAFSTEVARYCDQKDVNFYQLRDCVNELLAQEDDASSNPGSIPRGGLLIPTIGVGGHCLPKDGILLWWRKIQSGADISKSLILLARTINDESPFETIKLAERAFGDLSGRSIALLGAAYRFNSEDTRNSPTLALALGLLRKSCRVTIHDPFVKPSDQNLVKYGLQPYFTNDLSAAMEKTDYVILCTAHQPYAAAKEFFRTAPVQGIVDGCNLFAHADFIGAPFGYCGIGKGSQTPEEAFIHAVYDHYRAVESGVANELSALIAFLNDRYAKDDFNRIDFATVQRLAATCCTGCNIVDAGEVGAIWTYQDFSSRLVDCTQTV